MNAILALEDGTWYRGVAAGAQGEAAGERAAAPPPWNTADVHSGIPRSGEIDSRAQRAEYSTGRGAGESERPGEADIIVAKNRSGPVNKVAVSFQGHYSRFTPMAREPESASGGASGADFA